MRRSLAPPRSFYCLRHGVTDWNRQGLFQGLTDIPLNDDGVAQAHAAGNRLRQIAIAQIVSSPLVRASKTAEIVAVGTSLPVAIDDGIIECDFGSLEGQSIRETMERCGITAMDDLVSILPADGEPWSQVADRSLRCVGKWLEHCRGELLFVCHDAVMQAMAQALCGHFFHNRHGIPFRFAAADNAWQLEEI